MPERIRAGPTANRRAGGPSVPAGGCSRSIVSWLATGIAFMVAAGLLPGVRIDGYLGALLVAAIVAALNAVIPPVLAALRLPLTLVLGLPARAVRRRRHPAR